MFDSERASEWRGQDVVDPDGRRVGRLEEIYFDNSGETLGFACVKTGLFGRRLTFVPLGGASLEPDHVRVAYPADQIKQAPNVEPDGQLSAAEEAALFTHYAIGAGTGSQALFAPPVPVTSPRLMRYHAAAAATHLAEIRGLAQADILEARQIAGDSGGAAAAAGGADVVDARLAALEARVAALESRGR